LSDLLQIKFSQKIFEKTSNTKYHENPSSGSRVVPYKQTGQMDGQTDKHDEVNSRFSQFCERA